MNSFKPDQEEVAIIRESIDADTICFAKIYGRLNTAGYNNSPATFGALVNPIFAFGAFVNDAVLHICVDAAAGDVIWQRFSKKNKPAFKEIISDLVQANLDGSQKRASQSRVIAHCDRWMATRPNETSAIACRFEVDKDIINVFFRNA